MQDTSGRSSVGVVVASDIRLFCEGLRLALERNASFQLVGEASARAALNDVCERARPDVILLDMAMPEALQAIFDLGQLCPGIPIVALGVVEREAAIIECTEAGASGYIGRDGNLTDLTDTIRAAVSGEFRCSPRIAAVLARRVCALSRLGRPADPSLLLTGRELEVLELLGEGLCNKEIAVCLSIEVATVKSHVHKIFEKLNVRRRGQAVAVLRRYFVPRRTHPAKRPWLDEDAASAASG